MLTFMHNTISCMDTQSYLDVKLKEDIIKVIRKQQHNPILKEMDHSNGAEIRKKLRDILGFQNSIVGSNQPSRVSQSTLNDEQKRKSMQVFNAY